MSRRLTSSSSSLIESSTGADMSTLCYKSPPPPTASPSSPPTVAPTWSPTVRVIRSFYSCSVFSSVAHFIEKASPEISLLTFSCYRYEAVRHTYLCDDESFECDPANGFDTYLEHLGFDTEIQFSDATTVPLSGKVYIGRQDSGDSIIATGCPLVRFYLVPYSLRQDLLNLLLH